MGISRKGWSVFLLLLCLVGSSLSHFSNAEFLEDETAFQVASEDSGVGRQLLQTLTPCPIQYAFFNFSPVLDACPNSTNISVVGTFNAKTCCQSLCKVLGSNGSFINDLTTDCSSQFFTYLNLAGNYSQGFFASICTDPNSPKGIYCPPEVTGDTPPPPGNSGGRAVETSFILWSVILAIGLLELISERSALVHEGSTWKITSSILSRKAVLLDAQFLLLSAFGISVLDLSRSPL
ncbi:hypothetical protein R1flu_015271 [Riccia fluitans]|uniref:GPI-anchored protein LLG1-like domain-containing protein n=1 Tax=Riccia fluitans TaxID=41844 RepID=A0ABD1YIV4_9MARC